MPQLSLRILDGADFLDQGGEGSPQSLNRHSVKTGSLSRWLEISLEPVPGANRRSSS